MTWSYFLMRVNALMAMEVGAEADAFAWSMLGMIGLAFGVIGVLALSMRHHVQRRDAAVDSLLEELEQELQEPTQPTAVAHVTKRDAWERDGDWWKGES